MYFQGFASRSVYLRETSVPSVAGFASRSVYLRETSVPSVAGFCITLRVPP
jgi:hypothetical protein